MSQTARQAARRRARRGGFSLTEVLLALSILGVGMGMAIAVFPAALEENRGSVNSVLGGLICENGLSVAKLRVSRSSISGTSLSPIGTTLGAGERSYPVGDPNTGATRGFLLLGRRLPTQSPGTPRAEYQIVIVSYAKQVASNDVEARSVTVTVNPNALQVSVPSGQESLLKIGSPVIDADSGNYANIRAVDRQTATLSHPLGVTGSRKLYFIVETDGANPIANPVSPAMSVLIARTGLNQ